MSTPQKAPLSISTIYRPKAGTIPIMPRGEESLEGLYVNLKPDR